MKTDIFNQDNLKPNEIDEIVIRVKCFIINSTNQLLVAFSNGGVQLPGGHVENDEDYMIAVRREIEEETGIILTDGDKITPFYEIQTYKRNHRNSGKNRLSKIIYYSINTDKTPNLNNLNLTENEKELNFKVEYVDLNDFEILLKNEINNNEKEANRIIASEILNSYYKFKNYLNK